MVTELFTIPKNFCGPSETGHGGCVCGRLAKHLHGSATVRLKTGAPLGAKGRLCDPESHGTPYTMNQAAEEARGIAIRAETAARSLGAGWTSIARLRIWRVWPE